MFCSYVGGKKKKTQAGSGRFCAVGRSRTTKTLFFWPNWIMNALKLRLNDIFKQNWRENKWNNSMCKNYRIFKDEPVFENYLITLSKKDVITLCRFRCRSHNLPVNKGRFSQCSEDVECPLCLSHDIGDEFHYLYICPFFVKERQTCLKWHYKNAHRSPSVLQMQTLFNAANTCQFKHLIKFIRVITHHFANSCQKELVSNESSYVYKETISRSGRIIKPPNRLDL